MLQMNKNEARVMGDTGLTGRGWAPEYKTSFPKPASSHCRTDSTVGELQVKVNLHQVPQKTLS